MAVFLWFYVRNWVHKFPVLKSDDEPVIVSPAYSFEVNNIEELNPEYLMMWFRRSEFTGMQIKMR
jgi:hypothetical protein